MSTNKVLFHVPDLSEAEMFLDMLAEDGVPADMRHDKSESGGYEILVDPEDTEKAKEAIGSTIYLEEGESKYRGNES